MFDFNDAMSNLKSKEVKRMALHELVEMYVYDEKTNKAPEGDKSQYMTQVSMWVHANSCSSSTASDGGASESESIRCAYKVAS